MNHERALTIAGGFVAVVMVGLLSITAINGRWLGYPKRLYRVVPISSAPSPAGRAGATKLKPPHRKPLRLAQPEIAWRHIKRGHAT